MVKHESCQAIFTQEFIEQNLSSYNPTIVRKRNALIDSECKKKRDEDMHHVSTMLQKSVSKQHRMPRMAMLESTREQLVSYVKHISKNLQDFLLDERMHHHSNLGHWVPRYLGHVWSFLALIGGPSLESRRKLRKQADSRSTLIVLERLFVTF